jgi:GntR family transcriptional regulator/MocR family aminotransferase
VIVVTLDGRGRLGLQLFRSVRAAIVEGRLKPGQRLPSTRDLAAHLKLSRKVVLEGFQQLLEEGYLEARAGSGTRVTTRLPDALLTPWKPRPEHGAARTSPVPLSTRAAAAMALHAWPPPGRPAKPGLRYNFQYGIPALADFPVDTWARLVARRARDASLSMLRYGKTLGFDPLRQQIAEYLGRARGVVTTPDQVLVVNGTQQAVDLIARLLVNPGDAVVVEEPCYQAARQALLVAGAEAVACPVDRHGLRTDRLPGSRAIKLAYVTPSHQFPLGGILPLARRLELLRWAEQRGAYLIEDDYDSEFQYDHRPVQALQGLDRAGRVLYVGSLSKVLFPSLRIGYLVVPSVLVQPLATLRLLTDYHTPTFEQAVLSDFMKDGDFERHLRRSRARNKARRVRLVEALQEHCGADVEITGASAGLHIAVWLRHVAAGAVSDLVARAADRGVGIYPIAPYFLRPPRRAGLLLGYANLSERDIVEGVRRLGTLLRSL